MTTEARSPIEAEIESLKASVRRMKRLLVCGLLSVLTLTVVTGLQPAKHAGTIETSRLLLKDRNNKVVAEMSSNEAGLPRFKMFDAAGRSRLEFGLSDPDTELFFRDETGNATISFSTVPGISSMFSLYQPQGRRIDLSVAGGDPGEATFEIGRESGPRDFDVSVFPELTRLSLGSPGGEKSPGSQIALGTESTGTAFMDFRDAKDRERLSIESNPHGAVTLKVHDAEEKLLFKAP